ncbi:hypothetical protein BLS_009152 [Venturia inaequalis]|uniref:Uncharacterized protein n=1 Tax=Venturia inaequalis TaxID=5025 RepID=A0A8H3U5C9_VENIN|nr:hypothetical protein BLS_009152 [Venturia inaequalis]
MTRVIMTRTNIRTAWDLIKRAGNEVDEIAVIPDLNNLPLHIFGRIFSSIELAEFLDPISQGVNNCWIKSKPAKNDPTGREWYPVTDVPEPHRTPQINISQGLKDFWEAERMDPNHVSRQSVGEQELMYLLVVHGKNGPLLPKLVVKWDLKGAAQALMEAVQDGYSVVFSGATLIYRWNLWTQAFNTCKPSLMRVESLEKLRDFQVRGSVPFKKRHQNCLPILC